MDAIDATHEWAGDVRRRSLLVCNDTCKPGDDSGMARPSLSSNAQAAPSEEDAAHRCKVGFLTETMMRRGSLKE
jgi:hypothetical protein